jgi:hypothetical protein
MRLKVVIDLTDLSALHTQLHSCLLSIGFPPAAFAIANKE